MADDAEIRDLIQRCAQVVHNGDMDGVLADHAEDIVLFDVVPPEGGVQGVDAYRGTWPAFFEWQSQGALFEVVDLDVTAGEDVAYAHGLLRLRHTGRDRGTSWTPVAAHPGVAEGGPAVARRAWNRHYTVSEHRRGQSRWKNVWSSGCTGLVVTAMSISASRVRKTNCPPPSWFVK